MPDQTKPQPVVVPVQFRSSKSTIAVERVYRGDRFIGWTLFQDGDWIRITPEALPALIAALTTECGK